MTWTEALRRAEMVAVGAALTRRGLIRGREGNLSCRLARDEVLITPAGTAKGRLCAAELRTCRLGAPPPAGVSSEARVHLAVYRDCPDVAAIVHAHPGAVLALSGFGRLPSPGRLREGEALVPSVAGVPALAPGSAELAEACAAAARRAPALVLSEHGVVCCGDDLWQALERVEVLELLATLELARAGAVVT